LGGFRFRVPENVLALASPLLPSRPLPEAVEIPLAPAGARVAQRRGEPVDEVALLLACGGPTAAGREVAQLRFRHARGTTIVQPLRYGEQIAAWGDPSPAREAETVWRGRTRAGEPCFLRLLRWKNPRPDAPLVSLEFTNSGAEALPLLMGVTVVN